MEITGSGVFGSISVELAFFKAQDVARKFDEHDLHPEAKPKVGDACFRGNISPSEFALPAPLAESAGDEVAVAAADRFFYRSIFDDLVRFEAADFEIRLAAAIAP